MAHNESLTNKVREALSNLPKVEERKMFRGVTFMVDGKMCITTGNDELMCRIDPALHESAVEKPGCRPLRMGGREYKGYIYIHEESIKKKKDFDYWIELALDFNKRAKASPKKKKRSS